MEKIDQLERHLLRNQVLKEKLKEWSLNPLPQEGTKDLSHMMRKREYLRKSPPLDTKSYAEVLKVDLKEKYIWVEPGVTMEGLADATLKDNFLAPVIAEFKKITVGGAIIGSSLESSSFKFGQFNDPALEYEILLGNGEIIHISPQTHSDLFYGLSGSFGALGKILSVKLPLMEIKPYVAVKVERYKSLSEFMAALKERCKRKAGPDYIEGLVFNEKDYRILIGTYSDKIEGELYSQKAYYSEWYHQYVLKHDHFTMPTRDYLFRYDRGAFWMGSYALWASLLARYLFEDSLFPSWIVKPFKSYSAGKYNEMKVPPLLFRLLSGFTMDSAKLYQRLHAKKENWFENHFIVQDFYLPESTAETFIDYVNQTTQIKPLWICPCKGTLTSQLLSPHYGNELFFDVGVYGWPYETLSSKERTRDLELKCYELQGRKMFYSWNYLTEGELSRLYPMDAFNALRKKYHSEIFPKFYEKIL